jgi:hypothetical protein
MRTDAGHTRAPRDRDSRSFAYDEISSLKSGFLILSLGLFSAVVVLSESALLISFLKQALLPLSAVS